MPRTASDRSAITRIDRDQFGPHLYYAGKNHIKQEKLEGSFVIDNTDLFEFIEAGKSLPYFSTHADLVQRQKTAKEAKVGTAKDAETWKGEIRKEAASLVSN